LEACVGRRDTRVSALEWALEETQEQLSASDSRALSERDANRLDQARLKEEIEGLRSELDELGRRERALGERGAYLEDALQKSIAANDAGTGDR
jgi:chromosome segregation ATPase